MAQMADIVLRHLNGILVYCKADLAAAFMRDPTRLFSATKRKACGYGSTKNLHSTLYFVAACSNSNARPLRLRIKGNRLLLLRNLENLQEDQIPKLARALRLNEPLLQNR